MDYIVSQDKNLKPLSPEEVEKYKKQVKEYYRKKGWLAPEMTAAEKAELDKCVKESSDSFETFRKDTHRRQGVSVPFPLEDIFYYTTDGEVPASGVYSPHDPEYLERLSDAAYGAINNYLIFFYKPELYLNKEQLRSATDVALKIRAERPDLRNIPLAENPDCPTEQDFIRLGQWFLDANTAIKAEIARETAKIHPTGVVVLDSKDRKILAALNGYNQLVNQVDLESDSSIGLSRKTIGKRLPLLERAKYICYPKGKSGGISITDLGKKVLLKP